MEHKSVLALLVFLITIVLAAPVNAQVDYSFLLEGSQQTPPLMTPFSGNCDASLNPLETEFSISCTQDAPATAAHIHLAPPGAPGPIVFFFTVDTTFSGVVTEQSLQDQAVQFSGSITPLSFQQFLERLRAGDLYVNVHTAANPPGEIRGQIPPPPFVTVFAQWGNGTDAFDRSIRSDIILLNSATTGSPVTGTVRFYDQSGEIVPPDDILGSSGGMAEGLRPAGQGDGVDFVIPPLGDMTVSTSGTGTLASGSVQVSSDMDVGGYIRFTITGVGAAGVGESPVTTAAIVPVRRSGTLSTGLAIRSAETTPITVNLSLRINGVEVANGNVDVDLDPRTRVSMFLQEYFLDADTSNFEGSIVMTADGGFAAIALEFDAANGVNTTLPVTPNP